MVQGEMYMYSVHVCTCKLLTSLCLASTVLFTVFNNIIHYNTLQVLCSNLLLKYHQGKLLSNTLKKVVVKV